MTDHSTDLAMRLTERRPIIDVLEETDAGQRTLALLKSTVALKATNAEVGMFLELCQHYGLDPFAKEAWCAVSDKGTRKVLIMVGRDGLRKIAQRSGLIMDGDVIHEKDDLQGRAGPAAGPCDAVGCAGVGGTGSGRGAGGGSGRGGGAGGQSLSDR
jgi:hypothetical protein